MSDIKPLKGELIEHGADNYLHDPNKSLNYFIKVRQDDGTVAERWSKNLESVIREAGVKTGDNIVLNELGKEPIQIGDKTFNKTLWDLHKYEPIEELLNAIEHDSELEQQKTAGKTKENDELDLGKSPKKDVNLSDFELPDNIKNNYVGIVKNRFLADQKTNYYDKDDKKQVNIAFEERKDSLHTSRQDEKTIKAMLDMAESKGWSAIRLKGTKEFKQKAWLEASLRGIETKGYKPSEKDKAELITKQKERMTNKIDVLAEKEPSKEPEQNVDPTKENSSNKKEDEITEESFLTPYEYYIENNNDPQGYDEYLKDVERQEQEHQQRIKSLNERFSALPQYQQHFILNEIYKDLKTDLQKKVFSVGQKENTLLSSGRYAQDIERMMTPNAIQISAIDIKKDIRQIFQNGYQDGKIKNRDELVEILKERGYHIKENKKSIRVSLQNGEQAINLEGEIFTKDYDAIKILKENLEPDTLKQKYPSLKDSDIVHITAYKDKIIDDFKDTGNTKVLQASLIQLETNVKELASGKQMNLPALPINEIKPDIQVHTTENQDKTRNR